MRLLINRLYVMLKRTMIQPLYIVMLATLITLSVVYVNIPSKEKSLYIPAVIYNMDDSELSKEFNEEISEMTSIYHFYFVYSEDEVINDVLSEKANVGFIIPKGFFDDCISLNTSNKVIEYTTNSSRLPTVAREIVFSQLFDEIAPLIYKSHYASSAKSYYKKTLDENELAELRETFNLNADEVFSTYQQNSSVFKNVEENKSNYTELTEVTKTELPIRKIAALFIFVASLIGTSAYLTDKEKKIYMRASKKDRFMLRISHITASLLPISLTSFICLLLIKEMHPVTLLFRMLIYVAVVGLYSVIISLILNSNRIFYKVLPVLLILTLVFSGVFFDIGKYNSFIRNISLFFPPYYF